MMDAVQVLKDYIRFPSLSADSSYKKDLEAARHYVCGVLERIGFKITVVETTLNPIIWAERESHPAHPKVILYGHYDVQPPDPLDLWTTNPFEPSIRGNRIYGRGAADNKGPQVAQIIGIARALEKNPHLALNIAFMIEGEEEIGSPSFPHFLRDHKNRFEGADCIILSDTSSPSKDQIAITTGLRGLTGLQMELIGPERDLHSGLHGGAILNPIQALVEICASLHNPDGTVNVPGFYDDVVEPSMWARDELKKLPQSEESYKTFLGVKSFYGPPQYTPFELTRLLPTLEFNGIGGGYQGEGSKTVIPSRAFVKMTCRLVPNQDEKRIKVCLQKAIESRAPASLKVNIQLKEGGNPYAVMPPNKRSSSQLDDSRLGKVFEVAEKSIIDILNRPPLFLHEGGSIPIIQKIKEVTGLDSVMIGLFTPEDNLHAPNESFDLDLLEKGIRVYEKILLGLGKS